MNRLEYLRLLASATLFVVASVAGLAKAEDRSSASMVEEEPALSSAREPVLAETPAEDRPAITTVKPDDVHKSATLAASSPAKPAIPLNLPSGAAKTGVSSQAISVPQGAGKIEGMGESFSTNLSTGVGSFSVPIALPSARGGAQPSLALTYSSARGYGVAGMGWEMGVPFIARQTDRGLPGYQDPGPNAGSGPQQDRFVFNGGQELVPICLVAANGTCSGAMAGEAMPSWAGGWQYFRPRVEGAFLRFFWSPDHLTWRIQSKAGTTLELGVPWGSADTNAVEVDPSNPSHVFRWNIARQYDIEVEADPPQGVLPRPVNLVAYRYVSSGGFAYLSDIYDTPPRDGSADADLSTYAHHTRITYDVRTDPVMSFRRGYRTDQLLRVKRIDVASKPFNAASSALRELVRRYHLEYDPAYHASLLTKVTVEGRCAQATTEDTNETLPDVTGCPTLPAMVLGYQHVDPFSIAGQPGVADLPGYDGFDERVRHMAGSPSYSLDGKTTDLFDINSDGLPDILVTQPGLFQGKHGVYFGGGNGPDSFAPSTISVSGVLGANAGTITLGNSNVTPQDLDGDGVIDLLHMPLVKTYGVYTPKLLASGWTWLGRPVTTAAAQSPKVDFTNHNADIRAMDVNGDGLVDVVFSAGTEMQTFLSLGRYQGGDGQFGHIVWQDPNPPAISNDPLTACVPWAATPVKLSDADVRIADMNGDGLPDIVRVRKGHVEYWPGRGNGFWGTGSATDCPAGSFGQGRQIAMASSPYYSQVAGLLHLDDVNGDGLADLVQVRFNDVDIWLNVDGTGWTASPHTIAGTPAVSAIQSHVRLVDANGSGTRDILWGDGGDYKYVDLLGGVVPLVLNHIENGLGKTTDLTYASSTALMLADAGSAATRWTATAPMPINVVTKQTERSNLAAFGAPEGVYVTEYKYRDAVYEGRQREFRGFRVAATRKVGDANSPTTIARSTFLLGQCLDEDPSHPVDPNDAGNACSPAQRWRDNPREALKGLPVLSEAFDESGSDPSAPGYNFLDATGVYASTVHTTYRLRRLYVGLDGREVRAAFASQVDTYLYDVSVPASAGSAVSMQDVELELTQDALSTDPSPSTLVTPRSTSGMAQTRSASVVDFFGNATDAIAFGCIQGCPAVDETITSHTEPGLPVGDQSGWLWRTVETYAIGSSDPTTQRHRSVLAYDALGHVVQSSAELRGSLSLDRFHEEPWRAVAPPPVEASIDSIIVLGSTLRDTFGNVTFERGAGGRCRAEEYDATYAQLPVMETVYAGAAVAGPPNDGCGGVALTALATYDRGLAAPTAVIDLHGEISLAGYDGFGRLVTLTKPDPSQVGLPSPMPSVTIEYLLTTNAANQPYSLIHTRTQDGADPSASSYRDTWAYVDGLGRTLITLDQADPSAGDSAGWIASGAVIHDAKGASKFAHLPWFYDGAPDAFAPATTTPPTAYKRSRYDAFGHTVQSFNVDGTIAAQLVVHALSTDAWDAADLAPGVHQGTPASERRDGHGRAVSAIERIHVAGNVEQHETRTSYLATGEVVTVTRQRLGFPDAPVVRWMQYDSLGRKVLNVDPNTTPGPMPAPGSDLATFRAWRYAYNDAGDLVGTSDARGCGVNFHYDAAGRALAEDYSPCLSAQADYSEPNFATGYGVETAYLYDTADPDSADLSVSTPGLTIAPNLLLGRLVSVADRGAKVLFQYDARGRTAGIAKRVALPGPPSDTPAKRYAARWYVSTASFDAADRPVSTSTGAMAPELQGLGGASRVTTQYSKRGTVKSVGGSYGTLVASVTRDANGLVTEIRYGDAAQTTTTSIFDARLRLSTAQTYRAAAAIWSSPPSGYTPPSTGPATLQLLLEDTELSYDEVDNPVQIRDWRDPSEWPDGAKPVHRTMQYDDLYRLSRVDMQYVGGDGWVSPFDAENQGATDPRRALPSPHVAFSRRIQYQSFAYDWLGNTVATDDDAQGFYDRSLGAITNGTAASGPYQIQYAANDSTSPNAGVFKGVYDAAGNLTSMSVQRSGPCLPSGATCTHRFVYDWDEVGRLARARRWDTNSGAADSVPTATPEADLTYAYDSGNQRVIKTAADRSGEQRHTVYVFGSLELRRAEWDEKAEDYDDSALTEVPYLSANGARLARVAYDDLAPSIDGAPLHVLLQVPDHLGSTGIVIDMATGELVERTTYQAYGSTESDYRPERWSAFREDYRFTGKEDDAEVGLTYFGERYYAAGLGRWISPDPLAVHDLGADLNLYAYVHGKVFRAVDPVGLTEDEATQQSTLENEYSDGSDFSSFSSAPMSSAGAGNKFNPYTTEGRVAQALFGAEPAPQEWKPPEEVVRVGGAVVEFGIGLVPGGNSLLAFSDPNASGWAKALAVGTDVLSALPPGALVKAGVKIARFAELAVDASRAEKAVTAAASGASIAERAAAERGASLLFYSVQDEAGAARLLSGGAPWPKGVNKSLLGEGFYSWGSRSQAQSYMTRLETAYEVTGLRIMEARIGAAEYKALRTLDIRTMSSRAAEAWMDTHSLYGAGTPHSFQHVIRQTGNFGPEFFFSKDVFHLFSF